MSSTINGSLNDGNHFTFYKFVEVLTEKVGSEFENDIFSLKYFDGPYEMRDIPNGYGHKELVSTKESEFTFKPTDTKITWHVYEDIAGWFFCNKEISFVELVYIMNKSFKSILK